MIVTVSKGQQITIPSEMRKEMGLEVGSKIDMEFKNRKIIIKPAGEDIDTVFEEAKKIKPKHKLTPEQMDQLNERMLR